METKKIIEDLKRCAKITRMEDCIGCSYQGTRFGCYHLIKIDAAKRLEELEAELGKRTINDRPYEWISVEDVPYPDLDCNVNMSWHLYPQDVPCYLVFQGNGSGDDGVTHWMRVEPPKPKEQTFKDVFLKAFPKAIMYNDGIPLSCRASIFGGKCSLGSTKCFECWNQPYFETEGEGEGE